MNTHEKENQELVARLKAIIEPQIGTKNVGVIIGIYDQGKETYLSFGETALGNKSKPEVDTIFEIGSLTKPLTGLMLARLIESGKISAKILFQSLFPNLKIKKQVRLLSRNSSLIHQDSLVFLAIYIISILKILTLITARKILLKVFATLLLQVVSASLKVIRRRLPITPTGVLGCLDISSRARKTQLMKHY